LAGVLALAGGVGLGQGPWARLRHRPQARGRPTTDAPRAAVIG